MSIFKIVSVAIIAVSIIVILKEQKPEIAMLLGVATSIILLIMIVNYLAEVIISFNNIVDKTGVDFVLFSSVLKIIGVGYITEFASNIAEDAGSKSIANKILFGGKVVIMVLALPIVNSLIDIVIGILK